MKLLMWFLMTFAIELITLGHTADILNLALGKPAFASSTVGPSPSTLVDGRSDTNWASGSCFATGYGDFDPSWTVDLEAYYEVTGFKVINRGDCCPHRLSNFKTEVYTNNPDNYPQTHNGQCYYYAGAVGATATLTCDVPVVGRFFRISRRVTQSNDVLQLCELEVYGKELIPSCSTYSASVNQRMSSSGVIPVPANTPPDCANNCSMLNTCLGFNFKRTVGCEIVFDGFSGLSHSPDWKYYSRRAC